MPVPSDFLINLVLSALNTSAATAITYKIMESLPPEHLCPRYRRYLSLALACLIASLLYILYCWLINAWPIDARHWANDLVGVSFLTIMASQTLHGALHLSTIPKHNR